MKVLPPNELLYLQTATSVQTETKCCYIHCAVTVPISLMTMLNYYLKLYYKALPLQTQIAKELLNINKLVPIYLSSKLVLFPIKHKRAPIQCYINAFRIVKLTAKDNMTVIHFEKFNTLTVDEPHALVLKKWQESLLLSHMINISTSH